MGKTFWHLHHYCWALVNERRALSAGVPPGMRDHLLGTAIGDCYYVLQNASPDFPLLPEIYVRVGDVYLKLGNLAQAQLHYGKARDAKPDYWPAYARMADVNVKLGLKQAALDVLAEGLKQAPDEPNLRQQLERLSGRRAAPAAQRASSAPA
jgi:tetratricopeptide (TPR) repeat protein